MVVPINTNGINKTLILHAGSNSFRNILSNSTEYYFLFTPSDGVQNRAMCSGTGVINIVRNLTPGVEIIFDTDEICGENCQTREILSQNLFVYTSTGQLASGVDINFFKMKFIKDTARDVAPIGTSCTDSNSCKLQGLDCCVLGQCVKDKTPRPGVATVDPNTGDFVNFAEEYLHIKEELEVNPQNITNYPDLFFLCGQNPATDDEPEVEEVNPVEIAFNRYRELRDLYNCINPKIGEMSICTTSYLAPTTREVDLFTELDDKTFEDIYSGTKTLKFHSIVEVEHADEILYQDRQFVKPEKVGIMVDVMGLEAEEMMTTQIRREFISIIL